MRTSMRFVALSFAALGFAASALANMHVYVSPNGNDAWPGTQAQPKRTLLAARDAARQMRWGGGQGSIHIEILPGTYYLNQTFRLEHHDNGTFLNRTIIRAPQGGVSIRGSKKISGWQKVSGGAYNRLDPAIRDSVFAVNIPVDVDLGAMNRRGFPYVTTQTWSELIFDDQPMTLSQHPNQGWLHVPSNHSPSGQTFTTTFAQAHAWRSVNPDMWLTGYLGNDWAYAYEKVQSINSSGVVTLDKPAHYGIHPNHRYRFVNVLEAIDSPGEYYIDRNSRMLYFYPPINGTDQHKINALNASAELTSFSGPLFEFSSVNYAIVENIRFENHRGIAVNFNNAFHNVVRGSVVRNVQLNAGRMRLGNGNGFVSCDIENIGESAFDMDGGHWPTLSKGRHFVISCHIRKFGQLARSYHPAVRLYGVGMIVRNNRIEDAPHSAIWLQGNEHLIEANDIFNVCYETSDAGAIYMGRDLSEQGNKIWANRIRNVKSNVNSPQSNFAAAIYLDDFASGTSVQNNIIESCDRGILVGGGRDNFIKNNAMRDVAVGIHVDARGLSWANQLFDEWGLINRLNAKPYTNDVWKRVYPWLAVIMNDHPKAPKRNLIYGNAYESSGDPIRLLDGMTASGDLSGVLGGGGGAATDQSVSTIGNVHKVAGLFRNPANGDFNLFTPILGGQYMGLNTNGRGLIADKFRKTLDPGSFGQVANP